MVAHHILGSHWGQEENSGDASSLSLLIPCCIMAGHAEFKLSEVANGHDLFPYYHTYFQF